MLFRINSHPLEIEPCVYEYISKENDILYEPVDKQPRPTDRSSLEQHASKNYDDETRPDVLGLPKEWVLVPLGREGVRRRSTFGFDIEHNDSHDRDPDQGPSRSDTLSGTIDIDWNDADEPVKFNVAPKSATTAPAIGAAAASKLDPSPPQKLEPIVFAITSPKELAIDEHLELPLQTQALARRRDFLTEAQLHDYRRESRHLIRVVTRNALGLVSTAALAGIAPELLIAAVINSYCLAKGIHELEVYRHELSIHGLTVKKRTIALAVAEGTIIKLMVMVVTLNHSDFLVFTNTYAAPLVDTVEQIHNIVLGNVPVLSDAAQAFDVPAEKVQEFFGIRTVAERAADLMGEGAWSEPTKELLQNIFLVGAVQAGMEGLVDKVQEHIGGWHKWCRSKMDIMLGRVKPEKPDHDEDRQHDKKKKKKH